MLLRILLLGGGGREHALAWKLAQSHNVEAIIVVPGNFGTCNLPKTINAKCEIQQNKFGPIGELAALYEINFVIPTNESHLIHGINDFFRERDIPCFGPTELAARLEGSKIFAKGFMKRHMIPTARYATFESFCSAKAYIQDRAAEKSVIKLVGLVSGRGVFVVENKVQAIEILRQIFIETLFGPLESCGPVLVEEFLEGPEFSVLGVTDGVTIDLFPPMKDYKRLHDGEMGPNTGGMGCQIPTDLCPRSMVAEIATNVFRKTVDGMKTEGCILTGAFCIDFILTSRGPMALEYDVRFGDPELQAMLPLVEDDVDVACVLLACTNKTLHMMKGLTFKSLYSVVVVLADNGYPEHSKTGLNIKVGPVALGALVFYGGVRKEFNVLWTSKGRILGICGTAVTLLEARTIAYLNLGAVKGENLFYRRDIGGN
ncbi:phosphoribosylamine-glycine ligase [Xylariaceae sp. FL0594]|nr:phosphoribosylamine-glycine ligase [Xylariaceae sp. FL0594]